LPWVESMLNHDGCVTQVRCKVLRGVKNYWLQKSIPFGSTLEEEGP
jgi:hypothetical protein